VTPAARLDQLATVVVHHRRYPGVLETIRALIEQGCDPRAFVVVDNSEDPEVLAQLRDGLPANVTLIDTPNRGYGPAVNVALDALDRLDAARDRAFVLVSTHEALPRPGAVARLVEALERDAGLAVAGPALVMETPHGLATWSLGGRLTPRLNEPRHRGEGTAPAAIESEPTRDCEWLDGAFCLYRRAALPPAPFSPDFFMYFEETELHARLRAAGHRLACVPAAVVEQSSGGAPPFLLARNLQLFQRRHGTRLHRLVTVPAVIARKAIRRRVRGGPPDEIGELLRGWYSGRRAGGPFVIVNPLAAGLHHYTGDLALALAATGSRVILLETTEPSSRTDGSQLQWLRHYAGLLLRARRLRPSRIVITWPVLGYLDFVIARALLGRPGAWIILHDPRPLVYARGYGRLARRVAGLRPTAARAIVHSDAARVAVEEDSAPAGLVLLPLPIKTPMEPATEDPGPSGVVVRVLGQYKPDRDLDALAQLAAAAPDDWTLEIIGRGWPDVPGWDVTSRFISEEEFDRLVDTASVVLIPYRRFFQSGVAVRALERSTPIVGPRDSSLTELLGADSTWLVDGDDWLPAVAAAVSGGRRAAHDMAAAEHDRVISAWSAWVDG
jgi:GT2 family glycosyltransferase